MPLHLSCPWRYVNFSFVNCLTFLCLVVSLALLYPLWWWWFSRQVMPDSCRVVTPWTVALQAPLSVGFSRQEYWSGLPFPSPGDLPNLGIESGSPALQADSLPTELQGKPSLPTTSLSVLYQFHCIWDILVLHRGTQEILAVLYWCLS